MARARSEQPNPLLQSILPKNSQNLDALKALCKRILKLYIVLRKKDWDSYKGQAKDYLKIAVAVVTWGNYGSLAPGAKRIIDDCDEIKKEIENATKYADLVSLITKLHNKAIKAVEEEIPHVSNPSLRNDCYYAIISLIQEMMKIGFPEDYATDVADTLASYRAQSAESIDRFNHGLTTDDVKKNIDALLTKLVLLGVREIYHAAFGEHRILFPHLKHLQGSCAYVSQSDISLYTQWIKLQIKQESGNTSNLTGLMLPNMNIPYQMQSGLPYIFIKKEYEENLGSCTALALKDPMIRSDRTFYAQYLADPTTFAAKDDPADAHEIMAENETPGSTTDMNADDDQFGSAVINVDAARAEMATPPLPENAHSDDQEQNVNPAAAVPASEPVEDRSDEHPQEIANNKPASPEVPKPAAVRSSSNGLFSVAANQKNGSQPTTPQKTEKPKSQETLAATEDTEAKARSEARRRRVGKK